MVFDKCAKQTVRTKGGSGTIRYPACHRFFFSLFPHMPSLRLRLLADYGGALSAGLCLVHCAAGPLLLAWWGQQPAEDNGDLVFLLLSVGLAVPATWQLSSQRLRWSLWIGLALFAATTLLADRYPLLEYVQYVVSVGLISVHLLNLRHCRRCLARAAGDPPRSECLAQ
jgi:hypothetical protein